MKRLSKTAIRIAPSFLTSSLLLAPAALLLATALSACGNKQPGLNSVGQPAVAAPTLHGTPLPVCDRLRDRPFVAATEAIDGGIAYEFGTYDDAFAARLLEIAEVNVEAFNALEAQYRGVRAERHDGDNGIFVRYHHEDPAVLQSLHQLLARNVARRPAAARRVTFRATDEYVDMQLPGGGSIVANRTGEAANEAVSKWTDREPTHATLRPIEHGIRIELHSSEGERFEDIRENVLATLFACPELPSASAPAATEVPAAPEVPEVP